MLLLLIENADGGDQYGGRTDPPAQILAEGEVSVRVYMHDFAMLLHPDHRLDSKLLAFMCTGV